MMRNICTLIQADHLLLHALLEKTCMNSNTFNSTLEQCPGEPWRQ